MHIYSAWSLLLEASTYMRYENRKKFMCFGRSCSSFTCENEISENDAFSSMNWFLKVKSAWWNMDSSTDLLDLEMWYSYWKRKLQ